MVLAGENADEVTSNRFEGELGALYVATSEVVTSANTFDSDVGLVSIGPGLPAFGHNRYESNHLNGDLGMVLRSEEHPSELQSLMRISYAVFCLTKKRISRTNNPNQIR